MSMPPGSVYDLAGSWISRIRIARCRRLRACNLEPVAKAYRERYPDLRLVIAGDNDSQPEGAIGADGRAKRNVGRVTAEAAAQAVCGAAVLPRFGQGRKAATGTTSPNCMAAVSCSSLTVSSARQNTPHRHRGTPQANPPEYGGLNTSEIVAWNPILAAPWLHQDPKTGQR